MAYGPFAPNADGEPFASREQTAADFELIRRLGANLLRVYHVPPRWLLDLAESFGLKLLIDIPWSKHLCFLDSPACQDQAREAVRTAVQSCARHPAVFAYSVVNEIPPDIVRWSGAARGRGVSLTSWSLTAKAVDPRMPLHLRQLSAHGISCTRATSISFVSTSICTSSGPSRITWPACK